MKAGEKEKEEERGGRWVSAERSRGRGRVREKDRAAGGKNGKEKFIETEGRKEKRGCFIMAEATRHWNLFICLVDRKSLIGKSAAQ